MLGWLAAERNGIWTMEYGIWRRGQNNAPDRFSESSVLASLRNWGVSFWGVKGESSMGYHSCLLSTRGILGKAVLVNYSCLLRYLVWIEVVVS